MVLLWHAGPPEFSRGNRLEARRAVKKKIIIIIKFKKTNENKKKFTGGRKATG